MVTKYHFFKVTIKKILTLSAVFILTACAPTLKQPTHPYPKASPLPNQVISQQTPPKNFEEAKRLAAKIFKKRPITFYCHCPYNDKGQVDIENCSFKPKHATIRSTRVEWEHIVPAKVLGENLTCWKEKICIDKNGKRYGGRKCCKEQDPLFNQMEADLHNLVPAVGEINAARGSKPFDIVEPHISQYGTCQFFISQQPAKVEPDDKVKGTIARIYQYMHRRYGIPFSTTEVALFQSWDTKYAKEPWEIAWWQQLSIYYQDPQDSNISQSTHGTVHHFKRR